MVSCAWHLSGRAQISFLQGLQGEDGAAYTALAEILKDAGKDCSPQWVHRSTPYANLFLDAFYSNAFKLYFKQSVGFGVACLNRVDPNSGVDRRTGPLAYCSEDEEYDFNTCFSDSGCQIDVGNFHIFVKLPSGKTFLLWVFAEDTGETLKTLIV